MTDRQDQGAADARQFSILSPSAMMHALHCWYLRTLIHHYTRSAITEIRLTHQHGEHARHYLALATATRSTLEELEGE